MKHHLKTFIFTLITVVLIGCSASTTSNGGTSTGNNPTIEYVLPKLDMEIVVTYQLRSCQSSTGSRAFVVKMVPEVKTAYVPDILTPLSFNPALLSETNGLASHNITVELNANRTLKSINSVAKDQTGSIIGNVFKAITNVLSLRNVLSDTASLQSADSNCKGDVFDNLKIADDLASSIRQLKENRLSLSSKVDTDTTKLLNAYDRLIEDGIESLAQHRMSKLTKKKVFPIETFLKSKLLSPTKEELIEWWLKDENSYNNARTNLSLLSAIDVSDPLLQKVLAIELEFPDDYDVQPISDNVKNVPSKIVYRVPIYKTYELCEIECGQGVKIAEGMVGIPQLSNAMLIDFTVKAFEDRTIDLSFNDAGGISKLKLEESSRAANAVAGIASATEAAASLAAEARFGRENAEIKELTIEADLLNKRTALKEAQDKFDEAFSTDDT